MKREDYARQLAPLQWCDADTLVETVNSIKVGKLFRAVVLHLVDGFLRVKVIQASEVSTVQNLGLESKESQCKRWKYFFGEEPLDLNDKRCHGFIVSSWENSPLVTQYQLSYTMAKGAISIWKKGFGARHVSHNDGMMVYFKMLGRGETRAHPSGAVADEEVSMHQYCNQDFGNDAINPSARQLINALTDGVLQVAKRHNPELMKLVNDTCSRGLFTTGQTPRADSKGKQQASKPTNIRVEAKRRKRKHSAISNDNQKDSKGEGAGIDRGVLKQKLRQKLRWMELKRKSYRQVYSLAPPIGFFNTSHLDTLDYLTQKQREEWLFEANKKKWWYCCKILQKDNNLFCLPTTCGYQFCYSHPGVENDVTISAFFSMEGLGVAMPLQHGIAHHFMGAAFAHHTCIPFYKSASRKHKNINVTNCENDVLILAWGSNGGEKEVRQKKRRKEAPALAAVTALAAGLSVQNHQLTEERNELAAKLARARVRLLANGMDPDCDVASDCSS